MNARRITLFIVAVIITAAWVLLADTNRGDIDTIVAPTMNATIEAEPVNAPATLDEPATELVAPRTADTEQPPTSRSFPLRVTDSSTGLPIVEGRILRSPERAKDEHFAPWSSEPDTDDDFTERLVRGEFPATLDVDNEDRVLWFTSNGYGWQQVKLGNAGQPIHVELTSECYLVVKPPTTFVRCEASLGTKLWVWRLAGAFHELIECEDMHVGRVTPGDYRIVLEQRGTVDQADDEGDVRGGLVVAEKTITIEAGEVERVVTLTRGDASSEPAGMIVSIDTTGNLDGASDVAAQRLVLRGPDATVRSAGGSVRNVDWTRTGDIFVANAHCLMSGRYTVKLLPAGLTQTVELVAGQSTPVHFDMRDMATINVTLDECSTLTGSSLYWGTVDAPFAHRVPIKGSQAQVSLRKRAEPTWLTVLGMKRASTTVLVDPAPSTTLETRIECSPDFAHATMLILADDATVRVTPLFRDGGIHAVALGHAGELVATRHYGTIASEVERSFVSELFFSAPGAYAVTHVVQDGTTRTVHVHAPGPPTEISFGVP